MGEAEEVAVLFRPEAVHALCFFNKSKLTKVGIAEDVKEGELGLRPILVNQWQISNVNEVWTLSSLLITLDVAEVLLYFDS